MRRHRLGSQFALLAIICTLGIFLFPVASGPYPSVHGPASALRSMRAWMVLLAVLSLTFANASGIAVTRSWIDFSFSLASRDVAQQVASSVLRC